MLTPGPRIVHYRLRRGYTQAELAFRCSIPQPNLSNIEKGKQDLTVSTLIRIAAALEVRPAQLLEEDQEEGTRLTRKNIEAIARAVVDPKVRVPAEIRQVAGLVREILPEYNPHGPAQKGNASWAELKSRFSSREIQGICQRVKDEAQRKS